MPKQKAEINDYELQAILQAGRIALLPGYQLLIKRTQEFFRAELAQLMGEQPGEGITKPRRNAKALRKVADSLEAAASPRAGVSRQASKSYWSKFTPEERAIEMKRRFALREGKNKEAGTADQIDGRYTTQAVARMANLKPGYAAMALRRAGLTGLRVQLPDSKLRVNTYDPAEVEAYVATRNGVQA